MSVNYATRKEMFAYLNTDFGINLACKKFNLSVDDIEAMVGRYVRGKRKGDLRGVLVWTKVIKGGWVKDGPGYMNGHVATPGSYDYKIADAWTREVIAYAPINGTVEILNDEDETLGDVLKTYKPPGEGKP